MYTYSYSFLSDRFPLEAPLCFVIPPFKHAIIEQSGRIIDDSLKKWNVMSSLKNCVAEILAKFEGSQLPGKPVGNVQDIMNNDDSMSKELKDDLSKKSIEELFYIYHNPEQYIKIMTQSKKEEIDKLFAEVLNQKNSFQDKMNEYEAFRKTLDESKEKYVQLEAKLNDLYEQKAIVDSKFTVDNLIEELKKYIDESYYKPKMKLVNDLISKKISFDDFQKEFKAVSMKFHYYSLIRDKMNLFK